MKLELKHLAGYLPYGLKYEWSNSIYYYEHCSSRDFDYENSKPILRPLSYLTKEIEVYGEKFVPIKEYDYLRFDEISNYKGGSNTLNFIQVREQNVLLELHFDIYGLIEKGLAIDINTLKKIK